MGRLRNDGKVETGCLAEIGRDQDIARSHTRTLHIAAATNKDRQHLVGDRCDRIECVALAQREADIHHDEHIDAHRLCDIDRQVVGESTIDEQAPIDLDRRKDPRG